MSPWEFDAGYPTWGEVLRHLNSQRIPEHSSQPGATKSQRLSRAVALRSRDGGERLSRSRSHEPRGDTPVARSYLRVGAGGPVAALRLTRGRPDRAAPRRLALRSHEAARTFGTALSGRSCGPYRRDERPFGGVRRARAAERSPRVRAHGALHGRTVLRSLKAARGIAERVPTELWVGLEPRPVALRSGETRPRGWRWRAPGPWRGQKARRVALRGVEAVSGRRSTGPRGLDVFASCTNASFGAQRCRWRLRTGPRGSGAGPRGVVAVFGPTRRPRGLSTSPARGQRPSLAWCRALRGEAPRRRRRAVSHGGVARSRVGSPRCSSERQSASAARGRAPRSSVDGQRSSSASTEAWTWSRAEVSMSSSELWGSSAARGRAPRSPASARDANRLQGGLRRVGSRPGGSSEPEGRLMAGRGLPSGLWRGSYAATLPFGARWSVIGALTSSRLLTRAEGAGWIL